MQPADNQAERQRVYEKTRDDLLKRQLSNAQNFDKAILSVSTAALGFSLAFLKDIVALAQARHMWMLYGSWFTFGLAIVTTVASYMVSQWAIAEPLEKAEGYYLRNDDSCLQQGFYARLTDRVNGVAGGLFILGVLVTTLFVSLNAKGGQMDKDTKPLNVRLLKEAAPIPTLQNVERGAPVPNMQPVGGKEPLGAPVPGLQPAPPIQAPSQQPSGTGGKGGGSSSGGKG